MKLLLRLWLTGILFILVISGYILYSLVWVIRLMQIKKKIFGIAGSVLLLASILGVYYYFLPIGSPKEEISFTIQQHQSLRAIADSLKQHQIITSSKVLLIWLRITGYERKIQAGKITLSRGDGVFRASKKLLHAEPVEIGITIPEGLTIEQTAQRIQSTISINTAEFIQLCFDSSFIRKNGLEESSLEGYLYPDTYRFPENVKPADIIRKMLKQFDDAWTTLISNPAVTSGFTKHDIVTLASIVEKEATLDSERSRIAAVFHNRLKLGYPLGADPTVRYALKKFNGPLRVSELNSSSPYNTRKYTGLPPGPICSPGKKSLAAVIEPASTNELYFVAKWDGSGEHDFSLTNEEHERKKMSIRHRNNLRKRKKDLR